MLFPIQYIEHEIEKVHGIPEHFFTELQKGEITTFCAELFPKWMREKGFKGKVKSRFEQLYNAIQALQDDEKKKLYQAFFDSNRIENICSDVSLRATSINDLPPSIQSICKSRTGYKGLFIWLYDYILTHKDSPITKILQTSIHDHYKDYEENPRVCPFCGLENIRLKNSEGRADYDHYLHKSMYPFSAVNLKGLIPSGDICNNLKGTTDVLYDKNGNRTVVFYPFSFNREYGKDYEFVLNCQKKPSIINKAGSWEINLLSIVSDNILDVQLKNWERIFRISRRYGEHIEKGNTLWLKDFMCDNDLFKSIETKKDAILRKLEDQLKLYQPTSFKIKSNTEIIPRFLYFKFLKDDEDFAMELIRLFVEKPRKVDENTLEL